MLQDIPDDGILERNAFRIHYEPPAGLLGVKPERVQFLLSIGARRIFSGAFQVAVSASGRCYRELGEARVLPDL